MRMIIGILVGILIVFNWSSIKSYFDSSLAKQGVEATDKSAEKSADKAPAKAGAAAPAAEPAKPMDLNAATEQRLKDIAAGK
jgi:hypothetical protein